MAIFISSINVAPVLASNLEKIPLLAPIIRILTIQSYTEDFEIFDTQIEQPHIEVIPKEQTVAENTSDIYVSNEEIDASVFDTNMVIEQRIDDYKEQAEQHILEYKEAFITTGGTEDEFLAKDIHVNVNYEIKVNNTDYLSFVLEMYEDWISSSASYTYYNFDCLTGKEISLEDLLGKDYIHIANESIQTEIDKNPNMYFQDFSIFTTITQESDFYINEDGNPVIVFEKYEIAPGAMGRPEFVIKR